MFWIRKFPKQSRETSNKERETSRVVSAEELDESELIIWHVVQGLKFAIDYAPLD